MAQLPHLNMYKPKAFYIYNVLHYNITVIDTRQLSSGLFHQAILHSGTEFNIFALSSPDDTENYMAQVIYPVCYNTSLLRFS